MIQLLFTSAYLAGSVAFATTIIFHVLKDRQKKPERKKFEPKLKMENYPHV